MSAPAVNRVAWRGATWTLWHLEYSHDQGRTLCLRRVPPDVPCSRDGTFTLDVCKGCLAVLDHETANRLRLEEAHGVE